MAIQVGVVMDPIQTISFKKDTSLAFLWEAHAREWEIHYMEMGDLMVEDGEAFGVTRHLIPKTDPNNWFSFQSRQKIKLSELDVILMRKDPPFDTDFLYATYILEKAERSGVLVVNKPQSLRDCNEKMFATEFPHCCAPTIVSADARVIRDFVKKQSVAVLKPLDGMGGAMIFRTHATDPNLSVIIETLSNHGRRLIMGQKYIPQISQGDKRILLIDGEPIPYALARIPAENEARGNLAAGGRGEGRVLTDRDRWICEQVGGTFGEKGLLFVGIDVIGDFLTEINVTSPTCVRELDSQFGINISAKLFDVIEQKLQQR